MKYLPPIGCCSNQQEHLDWSHALHNCLHRLEQQNDNYKEKTLINNTGKTVLKPKLQRIRSQRRKHLVSIYIKAKLENIYDLLCLKEGLFIESRSSFSLYSSITIVECCIWRWIVEVQQALQGFIIELLILYIMNIRQKNKIEIKMALEQTNRK